ncbi:MAG TPA: malate synthase A [Acidimicrobiales bacterium]|nr:malate synthase A [Acidimicrobiales bacterium]
MFVTRNLSIEPHHGVDTVLTPWAVDFIVALHDRFQGMRAELLAQRSLRQARFDAGERPDFLPETIEIREAEWRVRTAPAGLEDRRVEITGPVERKMMINALNSGAKVFMADFEDSNSPTWHNVIEGQLNLIDAVRGQIEFATPGKTYRLRPDGELATLVVRPRGWHLVEKHFLIDDEPISASLFDFGLYAFHNAKTSLERGFGPYYYLPKLESHFEARLWDEVMSFSEESLGLEHGAIRATVLIETITAAFEMDEILYELRDHITGLNAGRWDYIFSISKRFHDDKAFVMRERSAVTMTTPFMRAYTELLVKTCHRRGAYAIGGMSAFIPNRNKPAVTEAALDKVRDDKQREAADGFDGTWVAHPDLVAVAQSEFDLVLGDNANQLSRLRSEVHVEASDLLNIEYPEHGVTPAGLRTNIDVGVRYIVSWLSGVGAAAINDLMEDAATAEISRAQVWQWVRHGITLSVGDKTVTETLVRDLLDITETQVIAEGVAPRLARTARAIFEEVALGEEFATFLTLPAYDFLD